MDDCEQEDIGGKRGRQCQDRLARLACGQFRRSILRGFNRGFQGISGPQKESIYQALWAHRRLSCGYASARAECFAGRSRARSGFPLKRKGGPLKRPSLAWPAVLADPWSEPHPLSPRASTNLFDAARVTPWPATWRETARDESRPTLSGLAAVRSASLI
jgi:hypothetical protein